MGTITRIIITLLAFTIVGTQCARLGCYDDSLGWTSGGNTLTRNSPERCRNLCTGFKYAGLKAGKICMCGDATPTSRSSRSDCNVQCLGESDLTCGGTASVEVFDVTDSGTGDVSLISIGCFKDNITKRVWPNGKNNLQYNNPKLCKKLCAGFKYAGLELGIECFCGDTIPPTKLHKSYCDQQCTGDNSITCGGDRAMEVYEIRDAKSFDAVSPFYKGCFTKIVYGKPFGNGQNILDRNSPALCQRFCATTYRYFALEDGNVCLCGDELPKNIDDPNLCNTPCPGDNGKMCGGFSTLDVYEIVPPTIPAISTTTSLGCFKDNITARVWNNGLNRLEKNNPTLCNSLCSGFKYAGVELGIECFCGDTIPPNKLHQSYCDQQCTGDNSITCGGDRAMEVYTVQTSDPVVKMPVHLGCFTKSYYGYPFKNISRTLLNNKPDTCLQTCIKFKYFALFDGNECECGYIVPTQTDESCNVPCPGDGTITCGGTFEMDIYEIVTSVPDVDDSKSIGCFQDDISNRVWPNGINRLQNNNPNLCKNLCKSFRYAGVQIGNECFCGNTVPLSKIPQSRCSSPCPGDSSMTCGGDQTMEVYKVPQEIIKLSSTDVDPVSVGCFEDNRNRVWKNGVNRLNKNTPITCKNLCTGYKYFGLELGTDCLCGDTLPTKRIANSRCTMKCKGNGALTCGGSWAIDVYESTPSEIDCGRRSSDIVAVPTIANGVISKITEFPWHVGIYLINKLRSFDQICGGTMVTPKHIVSAAHCFYNDDKRLKDKRDFKVAAGKEKKDWKFEDLTIQRRDVADIFAPHLFLAREDYFYEFDIAALRVTQSFDINLSVNIACVDWKHLYESEQLKNGNLGLVCGWGKTEEDQASEILRSTQLPAVTRESCLTQVNPNFRPFITSDKFCGGFVNQSIGVCSGDSGGGYVFPRSTADGLERFYLRGVVSVGQVPESHSLFTCNNQQLSTFTLVSRYLVEIKEFLRD